MIDASHANSNKDFKLQSKVVNDIKEQIMNGEKYNRVYAQKQSS